MGFGLLVCSLVFCSFGELGGFDLLVCYLNFAVWFLFDLIWFALIGLLFDFRVVVGWFVFLIWLDFSFCVFASWVWVLVGFVCEFDLLLRFGWV